MRDFIDKEKRSTIMETSKIERLRDMKKNDEKQQETAKEKMSRKKLLCVIGIPVGILVVIYLVLALFFQSHFAFRTTINGGIRFLNQWCGKEDCEAGIQV